MLWDMTPIDKLLYLLNTILLLVCATLLLAASVEQPRSINCFSPADFADEWRVYTEITCGRDDALLARIPENMEPNEKKLLFQNNSKYLVTLVLFNLLACCTKIQQNILFLIIFGNENIALMR